MRCIEEYFVLISTLDSSCRNQIHAKPVMKKINIQTLQLQGRANEAKVAETVLQFHQRRAKAMQDLSLIHI